MASVESDLLTVRVDESGDAGTGGKGTRWLVLAAIGEPGELSAAVEEIRHRLGLSSAAALHFSRIRRASDRYGAYLALARAPFSAVVVAADSHATYPDSGLNEPAVYYRHALKFVLERASQLAAAQERMLEFVIEEAGHFSLPEFHDYLRRIRMSASSRDRTDWDVVDIDLIRTARKDEDLLLGVADGVAHAFFRALEPMPAWESAMPIYGDMLQPHLWRGPTGDRVLGNGFTLLPTRVQDLASARNGVLARVDDRPETGCPPLVASGCVEHQPLGGGRETTPIVPLVIPRVNPVSRSRGEAPPFASSTCCASL